MKNEIFTEYKTSYLRLFFSTVNLFVLIYSTAFNFLKLFSQINMHFKIIILECFFAFWLISSILYFLTSSKVKILIKDTAVVYIVGKKTLIFPYSSFNFTKKNNEKDSRFVSKVFIAKNADNIEHNCKCTGFSSKTFEKMINEINYKSNQFKKSINPTTSMDNTTKLINTYNISDYKIHGILKFHQSSLGNKFLTILKYILINSLYMLFFYLNIHYKLNYLLALQYCGIYLLILFPLLIIITKCQKSIINQTVPLIVYVYADKICFDDETFLIDNIVKIKFSKETYQLNRCIQIVNVDKRVYTYSFGLQRNFFSSKQLIFPEYSSLIYDISTIFHDCSIL